MNISNQDYHIRMLADLAAQNHEALIIARAAKPNDIRSKEGDLVVVGSAVAALSLITNIVKAVSMSSGLSPELICESIPSVIREKEEKKK